MHAILKICFTISFFSDLVENKYDSLYGILQEMGDGMRALVAHSERSIDELNDTFDVAWLRQQVEAGCLTTEDVRGLIMHLARTISSWQAPVDAVETRAWVETVESRANGETELNTLVNGLLVDFLTSKYSSRSRNGTRRIVPDERCNSTYATPK